MGRAISITALAVAMTGCKFDPQAVVADTDIGSSSGSSDADTTQATAEPGSTSMTATGDSTGAASTGPAPPCPDGWVDADWTHRSILTIENESLDPIIGLPVAVWLEPVRFYYEAAAVDGHDLRFVHDGGELPYQIERWDEGATSIVWVRLPDLAPLSTIEIEMYYGFETAPVPEPAPPVFDSDFDIVWHFSDPGGGLVRNSAGDLYDGTAVGSTVQIDDGRIGSGRRLATIDDAIVLGGRSGTLFDGWAAFTLSTWIRPEYTSDLQWESVNGVFLAKGGSLANGRSFRSPGQPVGEGKVQVDFAFSDGSTSFVPIDVPGDAWTHLVWSYDGTLTIYRNGAVVSETPLPPGTLAAAPAELQIGQPSTSFLGALDELQIQHVVRSAGWIAMQHASMTDQLIGYGELQTCPP